MYVRVYVPLLPICRGTTDEISSSRWSRLLEGRHWRCPNNRKLSRYRRCPEKWRDEIKWNMCVCTQKGRHWRRPNFMNILWQYRKLSRHRRRPEKWCEDIKWNDKGRHCRCPNNRKLSGHRRCSEKWRNEMKWEEKNGYSMTEQKTESPQAVPKEMMRWTQTKYVTGSPLVKPFVAQKVFRCWSKY